jgi:hypothetical protein
MKKIYSYIEANGQTFRPPVLVGPEGKAPEYLAKLGERHYVAVEGPVPNQSPLVQLRGPLDLATDPELRAELERRAEPWRIVRQRRAEAYPDVREQLDALMKEFAARRSAGETLTPELGKLVDRCLAVKAEHPKPDIGMTTAPAGDDPA